MSVNVNHLYEFENFRLDADEKVLFKNGKPLGITPKVFELLLVLIENAGHIVEKDFLMSRVWADSFVEESNLTFTMRQLRIALGDEVKQPHFIETVPRRGYRFIAPVKTVLSDDSEENRDLAQSQTFDENIAQTNSEAAPQDGLNAVKPVLPDKRSRNVFSFVRSRPILFSLGIGLLGIFLLTGFFALRNRTPVSERRNGVGLLSVEKLTDTGDSSGVSVSPDGKLLAYFTSENGKNTIWLRQFATAKSIPIYSSIDEAIHGVSFTGDGEYMIFSHQRKGEPAHLGRISILGGAPVKIVENHHGSWSFSPDGKQVAFMRFDAAGTALLIADADGNNERRVIGSASPRTMVGVDWSPDGKSIAYTVGNFHSSEKDFTVVEYDLETGMEKPLTDFRWSYLENVFWLPDKSGLLISGRVDSEGTDQIWRVSLPGGRAEQISNDSHNLSLSGVSKDFSKIVATQNSLNSTLSVAPKDNLSALRPLARAQSDMAWTPDGKIVIRTRENIKTDLWLVGVDGDKQQLTTSDAAERSPVVSPDNRFVVFASNRSGKRNVWRMNIDGGNQTPLTNGDNDDHPTVTPDGKFVVFNTGKDGSLWKVPIEGGEAARVCAEKSLKVSFSPDGTRFAYFGRKGGKRKLLVKSFSDCSVLHEFENENPVDLPTIVWTKDGKSVIFNKIDSVFVGNLWQQSLAGGEPQKLTNFTAEQIFDFGFSPDDKQIAMIRGAVDSDAVLIKGFK